MKVAVYFATGFEEVEALSVVDVLRRGGVEVVMTGIDSKTVVGSHKISINMDATINEIDHDKIDMMILPGGMPGTTNLAKNETLVKNLKSFKEQGKWLAAICAAPSVFGQLGLLEGEKATCYPGFEDQLLGCVHTEDRVVVSGCMITAVGPGASLQFGYKILEIIKGKELSDKIKEGMLA